MRSKRGLTVTLAMRVDPVRSVIVAIANHDGVSLSQAATRLVEMIRAEAGPGRDTAAAEGLVMAALGDCVEDKP